MMITADKIIDLLKKKIDKVKKAKKIKDKSFYRTKTMSDGHATICTPVKVTIIKLGDFRLYKDESHHSVSCDDISTDISSNDFNELFDLLLNKKLSLIDV